MHFCLNNIFLPNNIWSSKKASTTSVAKYPWAKLNMHPRCAIWIFPSSGKLILVLLYHILCMYNFIYWKGDQCRNYNMYNSFNLVKCLKGKFTHFEWMKFNSNTISIKIRKTLRCRFRYKDFIIYTLTTHNEQSRQEFTSVAKTSRVYFWNLHKNSVYLDIRGICKNVT